ncbi:hypothetical protein [Asinibacterium sp. OR53]|uniref:hypothetical protein n=1 Tax=Asinibacterium sp. OR53 TaxID=925409 RepID=UPI0004B5A642|nr:hypothetical protein [Asinibacterium sp. OR53]
MAASFLRKNKKQLIWTNIVAIALLPLWMFLLWHFSPKRMQVVAIIDKTVLSKSVQEHISLNWVLKQEKFTKGDNQLYEPGRDYYGFFPQENGKYRLKGLEQFTPAQLDQLSAEASVAYITDAYGIYRNEWYKKGDDKERSGIIYGGMSEQDLYFLRKMRERHKLIITEFNCMGSPTAHPVRASFEKLFGIRWTGWVGRYFDSFDTTINKELPGWLVKSYRQQHEGQWPFTKGGIAFVHSNEKVVILENETELDNKLPHIYASVEGRNYFGLPERIKYPFWFDVIDIDTSFNHAIAYFRIDANNRGKAILDHYGIPLSFPAVTTHNNNDYRFFYFSGDFCDNPVSMFSSSFKGVGFFRWFMYSKYDPEERKSFFWLFYRPLVTTILNDQYRYSKRDHP